MACHVRCHKHTALVGVHVPDSPAVNNATPNKTIDPTSTHTTRSGFTYPPSWNMTTTMTMIVAQMAAIAKNPKMPISDVPPRLAGFDEAYVRLSYPVLCCNRLLWSRIRSYRQHVGRCQF